MIILTTTAALLLVLSAAGVVFWVVLLVRMSLMLVARPTVREGLHLPVPEGGWPALSIVVPVHNEERLIDGCARLLRSQEYDSLRSRCTIPFWWA